MQPKSEISFSPSPLSQSTYFSLPPVCYERVAPTRVLSPELVLLDHGLAQELGFQIEELNSEKGIEWLSGNSVPSNVPPLALAYAGHQFGHFVPLLGDGRAVLLGEVSDQDGVRRDIQLKGSGQTPFSRRGDGRAPLDAMLREYIVSFALHSLGIPTTRSLAVIASGESVFRNGPVPGGIVVRVASSHIRIGSFEYLASLGDESALGALLNYTTSRHFPDLSKSDNLALALLQRVVELQAKLIAQWQSIGFVHGVMNTDNVALSGETIDFGPCAFLDVYERNAVFSSIDHGGRYAYSNQANIINWNLARFAESLLPLIDKNEERAVAEAQQLLSTFPALFEENRLQLFRQKLGLSRNSSNDLELIQDLLDAMESERADFTLAFRGLSRVLIGAEPHEAVSPFFASDLYKAWDTRWRKALGESNVPIEGIAENLDAVNPLIIPRNHLVERALSEFVQSGERDFLDSFLRALADPFGGEAVGERFFNPPRPDERVVYTFCGT